MAAAAPYFPTFNFSPWFCLPYLAELVTVLPTFDLQAMILFIASRGVFCFCQITRFV